MTFGVDYLSAALQKKGYDLQHFEDEAASPIYNQETGDMVNSTIPLSKWRKDVHYGNVVIGASAGGQYNFAAIVNREDLKVTRIDIKYDFSIQEGENANTRGAMLARRVRNFYLKVKRSIQYGDYGTVSQDPNSPKSWTFGGRGSDYQIRIYSKHNEAEQVLRIELQLRKDLARSVWEIVRPNIYSDRLLSLAFSQFENTVLEQGLLKVPIVETDEKLFRGLDEEPANRKVWMRTQVFQAVINHLKETGEDLSLVLYQDVQNHFLKLAEKNKEYNDTNEKVAEMIRLLP